MISTYLFYLQPFLASFVFLPVPILHYVHLLLKKGSRVIWKGVRESSGDLNSLLIEDIQGNRLIQTFGLQDRESARFEAKAEALKDKTLRAMYRWANYHPVTNLVTKPSFLSIVAIGGYFVLQESSDFTMGKLIAFFLLANMLYQPISQPWIKPPDRRGSRLRRASFEILDAQVDVEEPRSPQPLPDQPIELSFEGVHFKYPERPAILEQFNLTLEANRVTAIVGHTGAGRVYGGQSRHARLRCGRHDQTLRRRHPPN